MLTLKQTDRDYRLSETSFKNIELTRKFMDRYKDWGLKLVTRSSSYDEKVYVKTHDLTNPEEWKMFCQDWGKTRITLNFQPKDKPLYPGYLSGSQLIHQCSAINIETHNSAEPERWTLANDFFYLCGYSTMVISVSVDNAAEQFKKLGFEPFVRYHNRRTSNPITILYKQLELCF